MLQSFVLLFAAVIIFVVGGYFLLRSRQFNFADTKLERTVSQKTGAVRRVYVKRKGLKAKLWFQPTTSGFQIRYSGNDADSAIRTLTGPKYKASAHLVIGRDGAITQLVPFDTVAWHAGISCWEGREGLNRLSLGIELDNAGALTRHGIRWRAWFGVEYDDEDVIEAVLEVGV